MAEREFYTDINLVKVGQLRDFRVHNLTTTERNTLAATLGAANEGLHVWDTDLKLQYYWNGSSFVQGVGIVAGAMSYKGTITSATTAPAGFEVGYVYVWDAEPATLTWAGQTFNPDALVQRGDQIIYRGSNVWDIFQADLNPSSETDAGYIRIATTSETNTGTDNTTAVSPAKLQGFVDARKFGKTYFATVNITALTPFTVTHNLNLQNKDAFIVRTANSSGSEISFDVDSVDVNSFTLTSSVSLTGVRVMVVGF